MKLNNIKKQRKNLRIHKTNKIKGGGVDSPFKRYWTDIVLLSSAGMVVRRKGADNFSILKEKKFFSFTNTQHHKKNMFRDKVKLRGFSKSRFLLKEAEKKYEI